MCFKSFSSFSRIVPTSLLSFFLISISQSSLSFGLSFSLVKSGRPAFGDRDGRGQIWMGNFRKRLSARTGGDAASGNDGGGVKVELGDRR